MAFPRMAGFERPLALRIELRALLTANRVGLVIAGLLLLAKAIFVWTTNRPAGGDEAPVGLMALHMLQGREFPIFYYGNSYLATIESAVAALLFVLFGSSTGTLRLVPLLFQGLW